MIKSIYKFFSSVKLAIIILLTLAATSIIGTVIEQQQNPDKYLHDYGEVAYKIFKFLGFTDVYHSWWYVLLLVLLGINLTVCSIERLPYIWKLARNPKKRLKEGREGSFKLVHKITLSTTLENAVATLTNALKKLGYKAEVLTDEKDGKIRYLFADKNVYARFGVYIVHIGILIVLVGGLLTAIFGYRGYMNLAEGGGRSNLVTLFGSGKVVELPFEVECDNFKIDFYPSGMPKSYISHLKIVENGNTVKKKRIEVNTPLNYKGIYFYQASYGQGRILFLKKNTPSVNETATEILDGLGQPIYVGKDKEGIKYFLSPIELRGQTAIVELLKKNGETVAQAQIGAKQFFRIPQTEKFIAIDGMDRGYYTGLQVSYDPGTWVVWTGSTLMIIGLFIAFFVPHKRVMVRIKEVKENKANIVIAGRTNKGYEPLEKDMEEVLGVLKSSYCKNLAPKEDKS